MMTYINYINWALVISACAGIVGFWAYTLEMIQGRVTRFTRWHDLDGFQLQAAVFTIGGIIVFLLALIAGAVLKSYT